MMRLSQDSARRPQEVQHLIHCCLAWNEYMPSVPIWPHADVSGIKSISIGVPGPDELR